MASIITTRGSAWTSRSRGATTSSSRPWSRPWPARPRRGGEAMQIAVLSDTHSRYHTVEEVLQMLQRRNINFVIHCGDIEDADTVWLFHGFTAHFVYGNCDTERIALQQAVHGIGG